MNFPELQEIDLGELPSFYDDQPAKVRDAGITVSNRKIIQSVDKRRFLNQQAINNAVEHLERLPEPGESFHGLMSELFHGFAFLPAIIELAGIPAAEVYIATLGFNRNNSLELFDLLDRGDIKKCSFVFSTYYRANEPEVAQGLADGLISRGHWVVVCRNHAKVIAARMTNGKCYTWESSSNMRSCHAIEQYSLACDRELYRFHRSWMDELISKGNTK